MLRYIVFDTVNLSNKLGIKHIVLPFRFYIPYMDHFIYNLFLLFNSPRMSPIIRVYFTTFFILGLIKKLFRKSIVLSFHYFYANTCRTDYNKIKGFFANFLERLSVRAADIVFVTTEEIKEYLSKKYGIKSIVLSNPIDRTIFHSSAKKTKSVLYGGRLIRTKGIEYLLEAFKVIRSDYPDYILNIVGGDKTT